MKKIIAKTVSATPFIAAIALVAYITEELVEDFINEPLSDFVYPLAAIAIFGIAWHRIVPSIQEYLEEKPGSEKLSDK